MNKSIFVVILLLNVGCQHLKANELTSNTQAAEMDNADSKDPFEGFNRAMWHFNYHYLDNYIYRPVSHSYAQYVPEPVKAGLMNFVYNLEEPASLVNNTLQGKWGWAVNAAGRFVINSTIGLLGLVDVANMMGMERKQDYFHEVLGYYGVPNGPFLMMPGAGPFVTREITTAWVDGLYFPLSELTLAQAVLRWGVKGLDTRAKLIDQERLLDNALDPYTFVKDAYLQHIDYKVYDGNVPVISQDDELLDEYLDELD